jgi:hypothetical protein
MKVNYKGVVQEISKDEFLAYEDVRQSGVTNMWNFRVVRELSGLCDSTIAVIIANYGVLKEKYLPK